jgi:hypothetical protein
MLQYRCLLAPICTMLTMEDTTKLHMDRQVTEIELVERARQGDKSSLDRLAGMARDRLRVYVYRLTQKDDLTQEIVQESLLSSRRSCCAFAPKPSTIHRDRTERADCSTLAARNTWARV